MKSKQLKLVIKAGQIKAIYDDALTALFRDGDVKIERASRVEPVVGPFRAKALWSADIGLVDGPVLTGFETRKEALNAEVQYINQHVLGV